VFSRAGDKSSGSRLASAAARCLVKVGDCATAWQALSELLPALGDDDRQLRQFFKAQVANRIASCAAP
jgi:hypothetical protein